MQKSARSCTSGFTAFIMFFIYSGTILGFVSISDAMNLSSGIFISFLAGLTATLGIVFIFSYALKHDRERIDIENCFDYTTRHRSYDLTLILMALLAFTLSFFAVIDYRYGETEKPIKQLNGFNLGEHYNHSEIESDKVTVHEGREVDGFAFYTVDKEQPSLSTYVYQTEKEGVDRVIMVFRDVKHADTEELAATLKEQLINSYGGKPSFTDNFLHHDNRYVEIWTHSEGVSVSIYEDSIENESEIKAQRETLSVKLRMMDALAQ